MHELEASADNVRSTLVHEFDRLKAQYGEKHAYMFLRLLSESLDEFMEEHSAGIRAASGETDDTSDARILLLGNDAGKTTFLYRLKLGDVVCTIPTIGFNVESVDFNDAKLTLWDIGGSDKLRPLWRHYLENTHSIMLFVRARSATLLTKNSFEYKDMADCLETLKSMLLEIPERKRPCIAFVMGACDADNKAITNEWENSTSLWGQWLADKSPVKPLFDAFHEDLNAPTAYFEVSGKHPEQPLERFHASLALRRSATADAVDEAVLNSPALPQALKNRFARDLSLSVADATVNDNVMYGNDPLLAWTLCAGLARARNWD
ncbi:MAG: hypothetical protein MHM6MM_000835 [Cercozoa sp. M6MM]